MKQIPVREAVGAAPAQDYFRFSCIEEPGHIKSGHPVLAGKKVDEALTGSAPAPLGHPGVITRAAFDEPVEWPGFSSIETDPDPDVFAPGKIRRRCAEKENISVIPVQSKEAGLTSVDIGRAIKELVVLLEIAPGLAAVIAESHPAVSLPGVGAGVEVNRAIAELDQPGFPGAVEGKGSTLVPGLPMVIAVDCVGVALALLMFAVVGHDPGRYQETSLVRAVPEGDPRIAGAVRNREKSTGVFPEGNILEGPGPTVISALVHRKGRVKSGQKNHDFPGSFVHNRGSEGGNTVMFVIAPALAVIRADSQFFDVENNRLADELFFAPGGTPILRAFQIDLTATAFVRVGVALKAEHENRPVHGDIEDTVDVVFVPYFKERFRSPGDSSDLPGSRERGRLLGRAEWPGSKEKEDERDSPRDGHDCDGIFSREAPSKQGRVALHSCGGGIEQVVAGWAC
tara:strand:- start:1148 stop:2512 length:1365 start_codon:yes stop_codon:yes gene_type:complete